MRGMLADFLSTVMNLMMEFENKLTNLPPQAAIMDSAGSDAMQSAVSNEELVPAILPSASTSSGHEKVEVPVKSRPRSSSPKSMLPDDAPPRKPMDEPRTHSKLPRWMNSPDLDLTAGSDPEQEQAAPAPES